MEIEDQGYDKEYEENITKHTAICPVSHKYRRPFDRLHKKSSYSYRLLLFRDIYL